MNRHQRIAEIYDWFLGDGYVDLAMDPETYPVTAVIPGLLERNGVVQAGESVLDLACGPGTLKACTSFGRYTGVDLSADMLSAASAAGYAELFQAEIGEFLESVPDQSFDMVSCISAAYFLSPEELQRLMVNIRRISRKWWLISLDGVPPEEIALYVRQGVPMYNHVGVELPDVAERITVRGWKPVAVEERLPMEFVLGRAGLTAS
jgi:SAM-dependent methyltransferase